MRSIVAWASLLSLLVPCLASAAEPAAPADEWTQWHWVYQGIAHAQPFVASGTEIKSLSVRVARFLPERAPSSPLVVEVRDPSLQRVLAKGTVAPSQAQKSFRWVEVVLPAAGRAAKLEKDKPYLVIFRSPDTLNEAPWILAEKEPLGLPKDPRDFAARHFACAVQFKDGPEVRFGPAAGAPASTPSGTRTGGGQPFGQSLVVELDRALPAENAEKK